MTCVIWSEPRPASHSWEELRPLNPPQIIPTACGRLRLDLALTAVAERGMMFFLTRGGPRVRLLTCTAAGVMIGASLAP